MRNLKITLQYDGSNFYGWQKQENKRTVQAELEKAFTILSLDGEEVCVEGSGRTDRGVHALGQVASVKWNNPMPLSKIKNVLNKLLPQDIKIKKVEIAKPDFHARFSAKKKTYRYVVKLCNPNEKLSPFKQKYLASYPYQNVDVETMKQGSSVLVGKHNFQAFASANTTVSNFEREIYGIQISKKGSLIAFEITGNGFLYNMVRIIVGTLLQVGQGKITKEQLAEILHSQDRKNAGQTMPACGLYLKCVEYSKSQE